VSDHADGDTADTRDPPQSFGGTLRYLGPGLIISASLVGSGELVATTKLGAETGFTLLWLILLGCLLKVFVQIELARYAVSSGETTLTAFNRLPGPRLRAGWVLWLYLIATALTYAALGGVIGGIVQAFALAFTINTSAVALLIVGFTVAVLVLGRYRAIEALATLLVVVFTLVTLFTVIALQATEFAFSSDDLVSGMRLGFPEGVSPVATALAAFGLIGVTGAELVSYPYWCVEKGYARFAGTDTGDPRWLARARGWIRVMRTDAFAAFLIYTTATTAFYLLGAAVLHRQGLNPDGLELVSTLAEAYVPVFGDLARWLLVFGAIAVLYSTYLVAIGASARVLTDFAGVMRWVDRDKPASMRRSVTLLSIVLPVFTLIVFLSGANPVRLIILGGIAQALFLPVASLGVLYLRYRHTDPRLAPGRGWDAAVILSSASLVLVGLLGLWRLAGASEAIPQPGTRFRDCAECPEMVVIPAGGFLMGKLDGPLPEDPARPPWLSVDDEFPVRSVTFGQAFALGRAPVTVAQFAAFAEATGHVPSADCASFTSEGLVSRAGADWQTPPFPQAMNHPVVCVSWQDAVAYTDWLTELTGQPYRLPSEAEWEYAARAGAETPYPGGGTIDSDAANFGSGPGGGLVADADRWEFTSPVGSFPANAFGLHDMQGNVLEWLADCFFPSYENAPTDGGPRTAENGGDCRYAMLRGGSWSSAPFVLRLSNRDANARDVRLDQYGLRVARDL